MYGPPAIWGPCDSGLVKCQELLGCCGRPALFLRSLPRVLCVPQADVLEDRVPHCSVCGGLTKPDIVFFGEPLPERFLLHVVDFPMADLLLILGTSLQVCRRGGRRGRPEGDARTQASRPGSGGMGRRQDAGTQCVRGGEEGLDQTHRQAVTGQMRDADGGEQRSGRLVLKMAALSGHVAQPRGGEGGEGRPRSWGWVCATCPAGVHRRVPVWA